ncbi:MAG: hypothetical protein IPL84_03985 [Chitinophagaceae bacterium]|nr:hypothetical protein [Chitinophagaceae bacterium]
MDNYTLFFFIAAILTAVVAGYLIGLRVTRKGHEAMQRKLFDAYAEIEDFGNKYKSLKQKYINAFSMIKDLEESNALLRGCNQDIAKENYEAGIMDGKQQGKLDFVKKLGDAMVKESNVLNRKGIVKDNETVINQLKNIKS